MTPYDAPAPSPPYSGKPVPKDVYLYSNAGKPVALCLSCAVARGMAGAEVALQLNDEGEELALPVPCRDCGE